MSSSGQAGGGGEAGENEAGQGSGTAGTGGSMSGAGTSGSGGAVGGAGAGGSGAGACGDTDLRPGQTGTFDGGVTVSYAADATGCLAVNVVLSPTTPPAPYSQLNGSPAVQLGAPGVALGGRADVTTAGLSGVTATTTVIRWDGTSAHGVADQWSGADVAFSASQGGTYVIVETAGPITPACPQLTAAGGSYDGTTLSALAGVTHVTGNLTISGAVTDLSALSCLVEVQGSLSVHDTTGLQTFAGLENLRRIGGNLDVYYNSSLSSASELTSLAVVRGFFSFANNQQLAAVAVPRLTTLGGFFTIDTNARLLSVESPALGELNGNLTYKVNSGSSTTASTLDLSGLQVIHGAVSFANNNTWQLGTGLASLGVIEGDLQVAFNYLLGSFDHLEALRSVTGNVYIGSNGALATADGFTALENLGGSLTISSNVRLVSFKAPRLGELDGNFTFNSNGTSATTASTFDLSGLHVVHGSVALYDNKTWQLQAGLERLESIEGHLEIYTDAQLTALDDLTALASISGHLYIADNPALTTANGFTGLEHLGNYLTVSSNNLLGSLLVPNLPELDAAFTFESNGITRSTTAAPTSFDLSGLESMHGSVLIYNNPTWQLGTGLRSLEIVDGSFSLYLNGRLTDLDFPALASITGSLRFDQNAYVEDLSMPSLVTLGGNFTVTNNTRLPTCDATAVRDQLIGWSGSSVVSGNLADACSG